MENDITYPSFKKITSKLINLKGKLINLSYSNGQIYEIDSSQNIYYCNDYFKGFWFKVSASLEQISFDGYKNIVIGINSKGQIFYTFNTIYINPHKKNLPWNLLPNPNNIFFKWISLSNNKAFVTDRDDNVYYSYTYNSGNWIKINNIKLSKVSFDGFNNIVFGVYNNKIFYATTNMNNPIFNEISGPPLNNINY